MVAWVVSSPWLQRLEGEVLSCCVCTLALTHCRRWGSWGLPFSSGAGAPGQVGVSGLWCFHAHQMCRRGALRYVPQILCLGHTWLGPFLEHPFLERPLPHWVLACALLEQKLGDIYPGPHGSTLWGQMGLGDTLASYHLLTAGHGGGPASAGKCGCNAGTGGGGVCPPVPAGKDTSSTVERAGR